MMGGMGLARQPTTAFTVAVDDTGHGQVTVEGIDVTDKVGALRFECSSKGSTLTLYGAAAGEIHGDAIIRTVADGDGRDYCENFLLQIDPDDIDRRLLSGSVDEPFNTARVLNELLRVLRGA